jgi:RecA-family ATPase
MEEAYVKWTRMDKTTKSFNFKSIIPIANDFWIHPGEFNIIIGDTKLGKTALAENIAIALKKMKVDYLCLEIPSRLLYRRNVQIEYNMTKEQVDIHYSKNNNSLSKGLTHINVLSAPPHLDELEMIIKKRQPGLVIIDTLDGISVGKLNEFKSRDEKLAVTMKNIAQGLDIIIIGIHHVPKSAIRDDKGKRKKLGLHSGKGDSALEQKADKVIGLEGEQNQELRTITSFGARDEEPFCVSVKMNKNTFKMTKLADLPLD